MTLQPVCRTALWRARFASGLLHHQMGHDPARATEARTVEPEDALWMAKAEAASNNAIVQNRAYASARFFRGACCA